MAEKMQKIGKIEKITVNVTYEWQTDEPKPEHELILLPDTSVAKLIERFEKKIKKSGLAFFRKREDSPPPVARSPTPPLPEE